MANADKVDLFKLHKAEYVAKKKPTLVEVLPAQYLATTGQGAPGGTEFEQAVAALYAGAYTLKMASKKAGRDYVVCKLECTWWSDASGLRDTPQEQWQWRLIIRTPDFVTDKDWQASQEVIADRGKAPGIEQVELYRDQGGRYIQALHVGPYEQEHVTLEQMAAAACAQGLEIGDLHHEIYLSDPRRVEPERLRTIIRHPVSPK